MILLVLVVIVAVFWESPIVIGLLVGVPSAALGYLSYRASRRRDRIAEQAGIATSQVASIAQVVDGLNKIIANLQDDNRVLRDALEDHRALLEEVRAKVRELEREIKGR